MHKFNQETILQVPTTIPFLNYLLKGHIKKEENHHSPTSPVPWLSNNYLLYLSTYTKWLLSSLGSVQLEPERSLFKFSPEPHHPSIWRRGESSWHASWSQELTHRVEVEGKRRPAEQALCILTNQGDESWPPASLKRGASLPQSPTLGPLPNTWAWTGAGHPRLNPLTTTAPAAV